MNAISPAQMRRLTELIEVLAGQRGNDAQRAVTLGELRSLQDRVNATVKTITESGLGNLQGQVTDIEAEVALARAEALAANTAASAVQANLDSEVVGLQSQIDAIILEYDGPEGAVASAQAAQASAELARDQAHTAKNAAESAAAGALSSRNAAASSATSAAGSATAAANSQTLAQTAASNASGSASSAATSAATASNAANAAGQSATAAASSASTAATKADEASTSAAAAQTARTGAETARSQAQTSATQAASSATNAATSAGSASTSATAAQNSATSASTSAASASTSANTASQASTNAGTSAALAAASQTLAAQIVSKSTNLLADQFLATENANHWSRFNGQGSLTKAPNEIFSLGQTWSFVIATGNQDGIQTESTDTQWKGPADADAYVVEVEFTLVSGVIDGAGVALSWINTANNTFRASASLAAAARGPIVAGQPMTATVILRRPTNFSGTFSFNRLIVAANWSVIGNGAKTIKFHRASLRVASAEDLGAGQVAVAINAAVASEAAVRANEDGALAAQINTISASVNGLSSTVSSQGAALATIDGKLQASYSFRVKAGTAGAQLELIASSDPNGAVSVARIDATNILLNGSVSAPLISAGAITADKIAANAVNATKIAAGTIAAGSAIIADGAITSAKIADAAITNAKIGDVIQSSNFSTGASGWRIRKDGSAEFNGPVISRQLEVDTGTFTLPSSISAFNSSAIAEVATYWIETNTASSSWTGTRETFMALVGREGSNGTVFASNTNINSQPQNILWGWQAEVVPFTRWSPPPRLFIKVTLHTRLVTSLTGFVLRWRLIKVT